MSEHPSLWDLVHRRRSVRQVLPAAISDETIERILEIARWTPSSYNSQPWHIVVVRERLAELWDVIEAAGRQARAGRPVEKFLERLNGYRGASAVFFVFLDRAIVDEQLRITTYAPAERVESWARESLGMLQYAIWLAVVDAGLAASLHHFDSEEEAICRFLEIPYPRFRLMGTMPVGLPAHEVPVPGRRPLNEIASFERWRPPAADAP
ncbi:MAG: nitroreductase family protein [Anaerolineae bacterium]|nr:nitroreductase family protein [Anaerolineae bacterium]